MLTLLMLLCCSGGGPAPGAADSGAADTGASDGGVVDGGVDTGDAFCASAQTVTWASWGHGFLLESCQGCHASTAPNRNDAPEDVVFDTVEDAWERAPRILERAAAEPPSMPPLGGTTEDDRIRLRWWLECGEPGT